MAHEKDIKRIAADIQERLVRIRRDFHMYPELGFQERRTSQQVAEILKEIGLDVETNVGRTGVVGLLKSKARGKAVALRADMDALPIEETNDVPYRSRNKGVMHACGHDGHTTMALGAAMVLARLRDAVRGNVKVIFQPAEETISGAKEMIADGVLENPEVSAIFGLHVHPLIDSGTVGVISGPAMAAANHFSLVVKGKGGHGANPHLTADPLVPAHEIYSALQSIRRTVNAIEPFVLSICSFHAGTSFNIVPQDVLIRGTLRTFKPAVRDQVMPRMQKIVKGVALSFGVTCELVFEEATPAVINDAALVELATSSARTLGAPVATVEPTMTSEDFASFQQRVPGAFLRIGTKKGKTVRMIHSPDFDFDEAVLPLGASLLAACALDYLGT